MSPLPTLFISHGAPTMALQPGHTGAALARLAAGLPRPRAILLASAHWNTRQPALTANPQPGLIYDFFGFPRELYGLSYAAPGAPELARRAQELLGTAGIAAAIDGARGLDHGAWVPLRLMYPQADIPVLQLSLQQAQGPAHHYRLGRALAPLSAEGVLLIGSGNLTHNLGEFGMAPADGAALPYVREFQDWFAGRLAQGDTAALLDYRARAPHAVRAHPTEEHLLPLFVALGAAGAGDSVDRAWDGVDYGVLAMDAYTFTPAAG